MYLAMAVLAIVYTPFALFSRAAAYAAMPQPIAAGCAGPPRWMVGLRSEVRGTPPTGRGAGRGQAPFLLRHHHAVQRHARAPSSS